MLKFYSKVAIILSFAFVLVCTYNYNALASSEDLEIITSNAPSSDNSTLMLSGGLEEGTSLNGWVFNNGWKFFENGQSKKGWIEDKNKWYFCDQEGNMKTGWYLDDGKWYYFDSDGSMKTGWFIYNGDRYFFGSDGIMKKGWVFEDNNWYFFQNDGKMFKGWHLENDKWHYLKEDGTMARGWTFDKVWYYMNGSGHMVTGWQSISDFSYYFEKNGKWNQDKLMDEHPGVFIDENGKSVKYEKIISGSCTAYTAPVGAITSVGLAPKVGYVAVDPKIIPYGTKMYVRSQDGSIVYGYAVAADTGGAMLSGRRLLDLYYDTEKECIQFGVRKMNAYILPKQ